MCIYTTCFHMILHTTYSKQQCKLYTIKMEYLCHWKYILNEHYISHWKYTYTQEYTFSKLRILLSTYHILLSIPHYVLHTTYYHTVYTPFNSTVYSILHTTILYTPFNFTPCIYSMLQTIYSQLPNILFFKLHDILFSKQYTMYYFPNNILCTLFQNSMQFYIVESEVYKRFLKRKKEMFGPARSTYKYLIYSR